MQTSPNPRPPTKGTFITLEGVDGVGKSTQCALLCRALLAGGREVVRLREPGGTPVGERVRATLLDPGLSPVDPVCELLLYEAARAQLVSSVVRPALERGAAVVSDRFFDSTTAYQGYGRELGGTVVQAANQTACAGLEPTRTLLLSMDPEKALARATAGGADRMEQEDRAFFARVQEGFEAVARSNPARVRVVDADGSVAEVWGRVREALADLFALPAKVPAEGVPGGRR